MSIEMQEPLIRVNVLDQEIGYGTKEECHKNGWLHRAFSVFLYHGNKMFIQRRALGKYHSGGLWSNACCSHPRKGEGLGEAVKRRLWEELHMECDCVEIDSFVYFQRYHAELFEYEYDHVLLGEFQGEIVWNPEEAMDGAWVDLDELMKDLEEHPEKYSAWFLTACPKAMKAIKNRRQEASEEGA